MPGFADMGRVNNGEFDYSKYIVRYLKVDADDPAGLGSLEALETKGLKGTDIVILNKASWTFMDRYLMLVTYLELNPNA